MTLARTAPQFRTVVVIHNVLIERLNPRLEFVAALAHVKGVVPRCRKNPGQRHRNIPRLPGRSPARYAQPGATREHHRPTGQTDRAAHGTHGITAREGHALLHQPVEVRRVEGRIPQRVQAIGAVVVGMEVENVGSGWRGCSGGLQRGQGRRQYQGGDQPQAHFLGEDFADVLRMSTGASLRCGGPGVLRPSATTFPSKAVSCRTTSGWVDCRFCFSPLSLERS